MKEIKTLRSIAGLTDKKVDWNNAALIFIDYQNEYMTGGLSLGEAGEVALNNAVKLLDIARSHTVPVFHVLHKSSNVAPVFNCESHLSDAIKDVYPNDDETVITKMLPNSFYNTELEELLELTGRKQLIIAGFMSHMCVTATTIKALELGYDIIVCENACASRALPGKNDITINEQSIHSAAMAALGDRYASIQTVDDLI